MYCGSFAKHFNFWVEFDPMGVNGNFLLFFITNTCFYENCNCNCNLIHKTSYHYFIRGAPNSGSGESRTPAIFWKSCSGRIPLKYSVKGRIVVLNVNIFFKELNWLIFIDRGQSGNSFIFLHYDRRRGSTAVSQACSLRTTR